MVNINPSSGRPLFPLGQVVATPGAVDLMARAGHTPSDFLRPHVRGNFGNCGREDWAANERAVRDGERVFSVYLTSTGEKIWVITEADRSSTCLLLPEEY